jgi:hypothetical protein
VPIFDPGFFDHSYGFRPNRSARDAVFSSGTISNRAIDGPWTWTLKSSSIR